MTTTFSLMRRGFGIGKSSNGGGTWEQFKKS